MARGGHVAALSLPPRLAATTPCSGRPVRASCARPVPAGGARRRGRGRLMVVRAGGPPSTNQLILAFVLPLSLFVGTLVTAARVADDLDDRFLREMEINRAILEENEASDEDGAGEEEDDGDIIVYDEGEEEELPPVPVEEKEPAVVGPRTRNRPRRRV
ncbi:hypothetical protein BDA96_03G453700 [Sorghum bicolor]|uniref:High chlorophyll fluorescence 153 n=2 Tax=Sorghum bicolor TaxID=4558 RepID=A0A921RJH2_SORBI|nr:uncharacterized protein LOC8081322 isoform X4 [Sorghum bicolor]EES02039.1 hypothetical protein SORBI_3003G421400 [Sorghum bicolor]KAG0540950.1 hypothetical protein BDA96_03G453700 [Sorghum bicolor]|eukprot:XP_002456919.1 uncharacterized protein LOC8081322 isoform X4 [Sorghum bicolor]